MKKIVGLWIDHREAVLVFISSGGEVTKIIQSHAEKHASRNNGVQSTGAYEAQLVPADDKRQSAFTEQLNKFYDEVIGAIHDAESILLFGPGEAKNELKKQMEEHQINHRIAAVETEDRMTDPQIVAKARVFYQKWQSTLNPASQSRHPSKMGVL
jgi:stalled ribosome rescue protein Dom34